MNKVWIKAKERYYKVSQLPEIDNSVMEHVSEKRGVSIVEYIFDELSKKTHNFIEISLWLQVFDETVPNSEQDLLKIYDKYDISDLLSEISEEAEREMLLDEDEPSSYRREAETTYRKAQL